MIVTDYCPKCDQVVYTVDVRKCGVTEWQCKRCGHVCDHDFDDDEPYCDWGDHLNTEPPEAHFGDSSDLE